MPERSTRAVCLIRSRSPLQAAGGLDGLVDQVLSGRSPAGKDRFVPIPQADSLWTGIRTL